MSDIQPSRNAPSQLQKGSSRPEQGHREPETSSLNSAQNKSRLVMTDSLDTKPNPANTENIPTPNTIENKLIKEVRNSLKNILGNFILDDANEHFTDGERGVIFKALADNKPLNELDPTTAKKLLSSAKKAKADQLDQIKDLNEKIDALPDGLESSDTSNQQNTHEVSETTKPALEEGVKKLIDFLSKSGTYNENNGDIVMPLAAMIIGKPLQIIKVTKTKDDKYTRNKPATFKPLDSDKSDTEKTVKYRFLCVAKANPNANEGETSHYYYVRAGADIDDAISALTDPKNPASDDKTLNSLLISVANDGDCMFSCLAEIEGLKVKEKEKLTREGMKKELQSNPALVANIKDFLVPSE